MNTTELYGHDLGKHLKDLSYYLDENRTIEEGTITATRNTSNYTFTAWDMTEGARVHDNNYKTMTAIFQIFTLRHYPSLSSMRILAIVTLVTGSLGVVGNIMTILIICRNKKLRTPTFAAIGCLAFPDLLMLIWCYFEWFTNFLRFIYHYNPIYYIICFIASRVTYLSCLGHIVLLCLVRYLITAHPLQSRIHLTTPVVILFSVTVWIISLILGVCTRLFEFYYNIYAKKYEFGTDIYTYYSIIFLITAVLILSTIITLHCLKIKSLKSSRASNQHKNRMNVIITLILIVFATFQLSVIFNSVINMLIFYKVITIEILINYLFFSIYGLYVERFLKVLNLSSNPYIYFLISRCCKTKKHRK